MNDTTKIAAELDLTLIELSRRKRPVLSQRARKQARIQAIKSACDKVEREAYEKGYSDAYDQIRKSFRAGE